MTVYTVTSNDGSPTSSNTHSLGYIVAHAADGDVINFAATVAEIDLTATLTITRNVTIEGDRNGDGTPDLIISQSASFTGSGSLIEIAADSDVRLDGLTIENGNARGADGYSPVVGGGSGGMAAGAILDNGTLTLGHSILSGNTAMGGTGEDGTNVFLAGSGGGAGGSAAGGIYVAAGHS